MQSPFKFLRPAEWEVLLNKSEQRMYKPEEVILKQGDKPSGIYIVQKGKAKVVKEQFGFQIAIAEYGPGAIFGEMSFIEAEVANTAVVAEEPCGVVIVGHALVQEIINQNPGFYGRFFQSLAYILSQRLRATTGMVGGQEWQKAHDTDT
jgi:extracellular factor (EF) 3-hydroxypalmitic acid methyl ester biosynthesis protein